MLWYAMVWRPPVPPPSARTTSGAPEALRSRFKICDRAAHSPRRLRCPLKPPGKSVNGSVFGMTICSTMLARKLNCLSRCLIVAKWYSDSELPSLSLSYPGAVAPCARAHDKHNVRARPPSAPSACRSGTAGGRGASGRGGRPPAPRQRRA